jgi:hypothetical protein
MLHHLALSVSLRCLMGVRRHSFRAAHIMTENRPFVNKAVWRTAGCAGLCCLCVSFLVFLVLYYKGNLLAQTPPMYMRTRAGLLAA